MRRYVLLVLVFALPALLGNECFVQDTDIEPPIVLGFEFTGSTEIEIGTPQIVYLVADTRGAPLQAYELSLQSSIQTAALLNVQPATDFDDDGRFFAPPHYDLFAGRIEHIVDVAHETPAVGSKVRLASVQVTPHTAGPATLAYDDVMLSNPLGERYAVKTPKMHFTVKKP